MSRSAGPDAASTRSMRVATTALVFAVAVLSVVALVLAPGKPGRSLDGTGQDDGLPLVSAPAAVLSVLDAPFSRSLGWWAGLLALVATAAIAGIGIVPSRLGPAVVRTAFCVAVLFAIAPAREALAASPETPLAVLAIVVWIASATRGRDRLGGAALGVACLVRFPVWSLLALEALRARTRGLVWSIGAIAAAVAFSLAVFGVEPHRRIVSGLSEGRATVVISPENQSLTALAGRLAASGPFDDPAPRPLGPFAAAGAALLTLALAAVALRTLLGSGLGRRAGTRPRGLGDPLLEVPAVLPLGILAVPIARDHDLLLLGPALIALGVGLHERGLARRAGFAGGWIAAVALLALPVPAHPPGPPLVAGWLASTHTLAAILTLVVAVAGLQRPADREGRERE